MGEHTDRNNNELLTEKQIAALIGVSVRTLQSWRRRGAGPRSVKMGTRLVRYWRSDVLSWIEGHPEAA